MEKPEHVRRYLRAAKHVKTRDERKELQRQSDERKAKRKKSGRRATRDWSDTEADDVESFERVQKTPVYWKQRKANPEAAVATGPSRDETAPEAAPDRATFGALVVGVQKERARVRAEDREFDVTLSEAIARSQKSSLAVGDEILVSELADGLYRAERVLPRRSSLSRPDPNRPDIERVLAANIDSAVIVVSAARPALKRRLVDRYTIALQRGGVAPIVCANKADLIESADARAKVLETLASYRSLGIPTFLTSALAVEGLPVEGLDELREELVGRTVVFVGQSGMGKSSLLNGLWPELGLATGEVRESDGKGRHTTTSSVLLELGDGTRVIDTPGVRGWGLYDIDRESLAESFPEFEEPARSCRFRDCSHIVEPDCRVRQDAESGRLDRQRYEAYVRIYGSLK